MNLPATHLHKEQKKAGNVEALPACFSRSRVTEALFTGRWRLRRTRSDRYGQVSTIGRRLKLHRGIGADADFALHLGVAVEHELHLVFGISIIHLNGEGFLVASNVGDFAVDRFGLLGLTLGLRFLLTGLSVDVETRKQ